MVSLPSNLAIPSWTYRGVSLVMHSHTGLLCEDAERSFEDRGWALQKAFLESAADDCELKYQDVRHSVSMDAILKPECVAFSRILK